MEWVASTHHTTLEHGVSSITTAGCTYLGCQQSTELTPPPIFKWIRPFLWEAKSGFCACAITFQMHSTNLYLLCGDVVTYFLFSQYCIILIGVF